jgi:hypothetical protein
MRGSRTGPRSPPSLGESAAAEQVTVRIYVRVWRTAPTFDPALMSGGTFLIRSCTESWPAGNAVTTHDDTTLTPRAGGTGLVDLLARCARKGDGPGVPSAAGETVVDGRERASERVITCGSGPWCLRVPLLLQALQRRRCRPTVDTGAGRLRFMPRTPAYRSIRPAETGLLVFMGRRSKWLVHRLPVGGRSTSEVT